MSPSGFGRRALAVLSVAATLLVLSAQPASAAPIPTAPVPTVSGTARVGATLTATPGTWSSGTTLSYQWRTSTGVISGATAKTFVVSAAQLAKRVAVTVTGRRTGYDATPRTSAYTAAVVAGVPGRPLALAATKNDATGQATLTWSPPSTDGGSAITKYEVGRSGTDAAGVGPWSTTVAATKRSQTFGNLNPGQTYTLWVKAINAVGSSSVSSTTVTMGLATLTTATPTVAGISRVNDVLTAQPGAWTSGTAFSYQWHAAGVAIPGATAQAFTPSSAQLGKQVRVAVTGSKPGYATRSVSSAQTAAITAGLPTAPSGVSTSVDESALTATIRWGIPSSDGGTPITGYVVSRDGVDAAGVGPWKRTVSATTRSAKFTNLKDGTTYNLTVTPVNAIGSGAAQTVATKIPYALPTPTLIGETGVYGVLRVDTSGWPEGTEYEYQWIAPSLPEDDWYRLAASPTFQTNVADLGQPVSVRVTGYLPDGTSRTVASVPSAPIARRDVYELSKGLPWPVSLSPAAASVYTYSGACCVLPAPPFDGISDTKLRVAPGTIVKVSDGQSLPLPFTGSGTATSPIVITSIHDDTVGGDTNRDGNLTSPIAGAWGGLDIRHRWAATPWPDYDSLSACTLDASRVRILFAASGIVCDWVDVDSGSVRVVDSTVHGGLTVKTRGSVTAQRNTFVGGGATLAMTLVDGGRREGSNWTFRAANTVILADNSFSGPFTSATHIDIRNARIAAESDLRGNVFTSVPAPRVILDSVRVAGSLTLDPGWVYELTSKPNHFYDGAWRDDAEVETEPSPWDVTSVAGTVTAGAGAVVKLGPGTVLTGPIRTTGTPARPVVFTSVYDQTVGMPAAGQPQPAPIAPFTYPATWGVAAPCWSVAGITADSTGYEVRSAQTCRLQ